METRGTLFEVEEILENQKQEIAFLRKQLLAFQGQFEAINREKALLERLRPDKTFGIAVSGDVQVNKLEVKIIDTKEFQRLRKIKQLGSTFTVYPSAVHARFEHSLGVLHMADKMIQNIRNNRHSSDEEKKISPEEEQIIRLLALLHDIGHMPYGHTIEDEFGIFRSHDKHETRWDHYLGPNSTIGKIIIREWGVAFHTRFYRLIKCEKNFEGIEQDAFMYDIVSNTVCADLLDYLQRDCLYTNLHLKIHPRFLNYIFIRTMRNEAGVTEKRIAIRIYKQGKKELRRDILSELVQLLRNRYSIGERVYYHHTKIVTGTIIAGAVLRALAADRFEKVNFEDEEFVKRVQENPDAREDKDMFDIHEMGDDQLVEFLRHLRLTSDEKKNRLIMGAIELANAFDGRLLYSQIIYHTKEDLGIEDEFDTDVIRTEGNKKAKHEIAERLNNRFIKYGSAKNLLQIEDDICEYLDMGSGDVLIYCPNFDMAMKLAKVKVEDGKQEIHELRSFNDKGVRSECKSIVDKHQALWALRVFVHPRYVNPAYKDYVEAYDDYKDLIIKYCEWTVLARDEEEEKKAGQKFWNDYIEYVLAKYEENTGKAIVNTHTEKKEKISEAISELMSATYGIRDRKTVLKVIGDKFGLKLQ